MVKTFINDDDGYSNFSFSETLKKRLELKKKKAQAEADAKTKAELDNTKTELEKTKAEIKDLKSSADKVAEQVVQNTPAPAPKSNKLPIIITGVVFISIVTIIFIRINKI
jgi:hypothetical protein